MSGLPASAHVAHSFSGIDLPELGQSADLISDSATEQRLGQAFLRQLRATTPMWPDPLVRDYVEKLTYRLATHSPLTDPKFTFVVVNNRSINAFAVPGGVLGINTGLLLSAETEGEVAGVMAHEIGHLSQRHFARSQEANRFNQWLALGGLLASIAAASAGGSNGGDIGFAVGASAQALAIQNRLSYSRAFEQEADRIGMQILTLAGYDPRDMPNFFLRLERSTRQLGFVPEFLLTHPLSTTRLSDLERRVSEQPRKTRIATPDFKLIQTRLQIAYSNQIHEVISAYEESVRSGNPPNYTRLGLSLAYLRQGETAKAKAALAPLLAEEPNRIDYLVTAMDIAFAERDFETAVRLGQQGLAIHPDSRALIERISRPALALGKPKIFRMTLESALRQHPNDIQLWRIMSDTATADKDTMAAFRARAELFFLSNRMAAAEEQLNNALRLAADNYSLTAQLQRRLNEMRRLDAEFRR
jgi:predicted Zn-dependent protease